MRSFLNSFNSRNAAPSNRAPRSPAGAQAHAQQDLPAQRMRVAPAAERTRDSQLQQRVDSHCRDRLVGATRRRIANLVASQSNEQPLQAIEHLARGNRQIAVLAAVVSSETEIDYAKEYRLARFVPSENPRREIFVRTADEGVQKVRHQDVASEGSYRILLPSSAPALGATVTPPAFASNRTKSEVLVHALLTALAENSGEQATIATQGAGSDGFVHPVKEDLLHQRIIAHLPWQAAAKSLPPQQGHDVVQASQPGRPGSITALDPAALAAEVMSLDHLPHLGFIQRLAVRSEPCATFFSFISHALLVKDSMTATPVERYPYVADAALLSEKIESSGEPFLPTFLDGVQRHYDPFNSDNASWRIHTEGAWQDGQDKRSVLIHVFLQAIQHLHTSASMTPDMPIYPLVAYELLADAIGVPVPPYLVEHEQGILSTLTENRLHNEQREEQISTQQQRDRMEKQRGEIELQRHYAANDVSNSGQFHLAITGYQRSLADASVDILLAPPADIGHAALVADWSGRLALTHDKQEISARTHGARPDNLCWLRSSWLSVFAMTSPAQLEAKLSTICDVSTYSAADAPILRAIAQAYQENPAVFLQGLHASAGEAPLSVNAVRQRSAHLGPNLPLAELLSVQPGAAGQSLKIHRTPEGFLQQLQCEIATAFRPPVTSDRSFMDEIESLQRPGIPASSNLPVTLHRALGLPVLVIETGSTVSHGEDGEQINQSAQLRVSAPNGSNLAILAELLAETPGLPAMAANTLLGRFRDMPVIWLDDGHYSVYLPKVHLATTGQPVMQSARVVS